MLYRNKKFFFSLILIIFLINGFFVYANSAQAVEPAPPAVAPAVTVPITNQSIADKAAADKAKLDAAEKAKGSPLTAAEELAAINANVAPAGAKPPNANEPKEWNQRIPILFHLIGGIFFVILKILNLLVWLGANLADSILKITSFTKVSVVTIGWGITRSLANMFFALILLIMSISTILQIDSFSYKTMLKRLIIVALLINFSLVFAGIIIDFSQVMTDYFISAGAGGAGGNGLSANLTNGLKITEVYNFGDVNQSFFEKVTTVVWGPTLQMLVEQFMAIILFMAAAFSFFAMSFFLIARIVWIWLCLIFAPLAWVSYIIPNAPGQLGGLWGKWWQKFLSWTLFAPIYAFFLYLALTIAKFGVNLNTGAWGNVASEQKALQSKFFAAPETVLQYIVIIMILLGGLKAAQTMSVTGASGAMNIVNKTGKWAGNKAKGYAKRPANAIYDKYANKAVQMAGGAASAVGLKRFGRRITAKGVQMQTKPEEREQHKAYGKLLGSMSDMDLQQEVTKAYGIRKLIAARQAKERGLLEKTEDAATVRKAMATFGAYGLKDDKNKTKEQRDLEDVRFDVLDNDEDKKTAIRRAKENGNLDKLKPVVLGNEKAVNAITAELSPPEFTEIFKKWGKKSKQAAEEALLKSFADMTKLSGDALKAEIKKREMFAAATDKISTAFSNNGVLDDEGKKKLAKYVANMTAAKVADIRNPETKEKDLELVGQYAKPELIAAFMRERGASAEQKVFFAAGVEKNDDNAAKKFLETNPGAAVVQEEGKKNRSKKNQRGPRQKQE